MNNVKVISTGSYAPSKIMSNKDFEKIVDTNDEWIVQRTGIKNRHFSTGENTSDLAYQAALNAIQKVDYDTKKIDLIIVATFTPDYLSPGVANLVQAKLGLSEQDITCFDLNSGCTGLIYALNVAGSMLNSGKYQSALIIGAEVITKVIDFNDRNTCVLFGDGAGCLILENTVEDKLAYFYSTSQGELNKTLYVDEFIHMDGKRVYQFAVGAVEKAINKVLDDSGISLDEVTRIIPHQANIRIIQSVAKSLKIDMDKFFLNIDQYGNTSAASIAIALDEYINSKKSVENEKLLLVGFGSGFTYGAALITL
ncbi:ketoacyl-ACP synthase III [Mycoplasmatota bacterium]|nr:ketoacyl-ACP synthase III [Mycoplasmatota bacterium]